MAVGIAYGMVLLYSPYGRHNTGGHPGFWDKLHEVVFSLVGAGGYLDFEGERFTDLFHGTVLAFGLSALVLVAWLALRPSRPISVLSPQDEQRLRELLHRNGERDSLGYFALRRDKSVVWSASGKAAITYRVVSGVALASGDPIGDLQAWPGAMAAYQALNEEFGWTPAVMGCSELGATVFNRELGLNALALGDEAIVEVAEFSLDGRAMRGAAVPCTKVSAGWVLRDSAAGVLDRAVRDGGAARGLGRVARRRCRAWFLDGAVAARRPSGRRLCCRDRTQRRANARVAALRALGC